MCFPAIGSFIPIFLETLARQNGVLAGNRSQPCPSSDVHVDNSPRDDDPFGVLRKSHHQCIITLLGIEVSTASFAMYTFSVSVLIQALVVVSISSAADHGHFRKRLLLGFGWIGGLAVMAYVLVDQSTYLIGAILAIVSNTAFGASFVLLNSYLPLLVRHHPDALAARRYEQQSSHGRVPASESESGSEPDHDLDAHSPVLHPPHMESTSYFEGALPLEADPLLANPLPEPALYTHQPADPAISIHVSSSSSSTSSSSSMSDASEPPLITSSTTTNPLPSVELQLSTYISTKGVGIGYSAALFVQCLAIGVVVMGRSSDWSLRLALLLIGSWWTIFMIPSAVCLRPRPGPPLAATHTYSHGDWRSWRIFHWVPYVAQAWTVLFRTMRLARRLVDIMLFLGAWFLLSDAIATTSSTAILFAKNELYMKPWSLAMINVISTTAGIAGAFGWPVLSRILGLRPHQTMLACIALFEMIPVYGLLGYLPLVQTWGVFGLQRPWEMFPLAAVYGFVLGGLSAYSRSLFGELIPPGSEAAFYALYAITDKGSSVFGPSIVGAIIDGFGGIRPAFWFLLVVVALPAPLIYHVDMERGKKEGERLARSSRGL